MTPPPDLDRLFALSIDLLCVADLDGRFRRVSPSFTRTLGHSEAELLARPWLHWVHPDDVEPTVRAGEALTRGEPVLGFENRYRCADGSWRWLEWSSYPADGLIYAVARDTTERRRAEEALRAAERRLRDIVAGAFNAFVAIDEDGRIVEWNRQAELTFGWSREEALGARVRDLIIPPAQREAHDRGLARYLATGRPGPMLDRLTEVTALTRDGREVPVEMSMTASRIEGGVAFNAFLHDLRERKLEQGRRVQTAKLAALGQMVAGVAHEINNPLSFVASNVAVLERDLQAVRALLLLHAEAAPALEAAAPEHAARIRAAAAEMDLEYVLANLGRLLGRTREGLRRIQQIVKDLRDFARLDESERQLSDVNEGIRSTVNIMRGAAKASGVDIELDLAPLPPLACFPAKLNQVVMNLVANAIDASPDGGAVQVRTRASDTAIALEVVDHGQGIPRDVVDRIFDPFFTTKPPGAGTGLGLSISYGIVKDHGGTIAVESEPGRGSRFTVTLPR